MAISNNRRKSLISTYFRSQELGRLRTVRDWAKQNSSAQPSGSVPLIPRRNSDRQAHPRFLALRGIPDKAMGDEKVTGALIISRRSQLGAVRHRFLSRLGSKVPLLIIAGPGQLCRFKGLSKLTKHLWGGQGPQRGVSKESRSGACVSLKLIQIRALPAHHLPSWVQNLVLSVGGRTGRIVH